MVALEGDSKEKVGAIYKLAMELGGTDEGPPGPRSEGFYAAYFRDPDARTGIADAEGLRDRRCCRAMTAGPAHPLCRRMVNILLWTDQGACFI